jgi:hypothetical protein
MDIRRAEALLVEEARTRMSFLVAPASLLEKAENLRDLCRVFEALGICKWLSSADLNGFRENMIRAAQARGYFLRKSFEEGDDANRFLAISRVRAVLDAVVVNEWSLARRLAAASIREWHRDWEYEADFCYFLFMHGLVEDAAWAKTPAARKLLDRFAAALEGQPSARLSLCRALHEGHAVEFRDALEQLLQEHADTHDVQRAAMTEYSANAAFWPNSFVCIEALAWLAFARCVHMEPDDEFRFCPMPTRRMRGTIAVTDLFESLDHALRQG